MSGLLRVGDSYFISLLGTVSKTESGFEEATHDFEEVSKKMKVPGSRKRGQLRIKSNFFLWVV